MEEQDKIVSMLPEIVRVLGPVDNKTADFPASAQKRDDETYRVPNVSRSSGTADSRILLAGECASAGLLCLYPHRYSLCLADPLGLKVLRFLRKDVGELQSLHPI